VHNDTKILCFRVIYGKVGGIFYLTTPITTLLRTFRAWKVPQDYENIFFMCRGPHLLVQCIAVNIRMWLEFFFHPDFYAHGRYHKSTKIYFLCVGVHAF